MKYEDKVRDIGEKIKSVRLEKGLTQLDLAVKCNIEQSSLARIESGRTNPTIITLFTIAEALELEVKSLL